MPQPTTAPNHGTHAQLDIFEYPAGPEPLAAGWLGWEEPAPPEPEEPEAQPEDHSRAEAEAAARAELDRRLAEEGRKGFEAGREQGRQEGRLAEREAQAQALAAANQQRIQQTAELLDNFSRERDQFLQRVEHEVVELALAVSARILRREAQMDPLLLTGAVRVALGQLASTTAVRLRVPPAELAMWAESMAVIPNLGLRPTVVAGEGMRLGDCMIETELGSVDLGIRAQLGEIERGFFDRAPGHRTPPPEPAAQPTSAGRS
jgi:flagellar assembly protein FliH